MDKERNDKPSRYRAAREDGTVGSLEKTISDIFKLPEGSFSIKNPDGRNTRSDKKIGSLRSDYDQ